MPGLGWRRFAPGEVLTASNLQGYGIDQSVQVYAGTAARGSAVGTAVSEGMVSYLADSDLIEVYNGSAWKQVSGLTGNVLQVVQGTTTTQFSTSSTSFVDTTLTATITPKRASSRVAVFVSQVGFGAYGGGANQFQVNLVRNSTELTMSNTQINVGGQTVYGNFINFLDSPNTTSATTYKTQAKVAVSSSAIFFQWPPVSGTPQSTIILMEIAG